MMANKETRVEWDIKKREKVEKNDASDIQSC